MRSLAKNHWLFLAGLLLVIVFCARYALLTPVDFDEGFNLQIPQNAAAGLGYAPNSGVLFDPDVTTGAPVLLPIALAFKVSKVSIYPARAVMILYLVLFCSLLYVLLNRWYGKLAALSGVFITLLIPNLLHFSVKVYGETPGAAFILLGLFLFDANFLVLSGIAFALAGLTKLINLAALAPLAVFAVIQLIAGRKTIIPVLARYLKVLGGLVLPFAAWEIYRFLLLGPEQYRANVDQTIAFFNRFNGGGVIDFPYMAQRATMISSVFNFQRLWPGMILILLAVICPFFLLRRRKSESRLTSLSIPLISLVFIIWWIFFRNSGMWRHFFPAALFIGAMIGVFISQVVLLGWDLLRKIPAFTTVSTSARIKNVYYAAAFLLIITAAILPIARQRVQSYVQEMNGPYLHLQKEFARKIVELKAEGGEFGYWEWWQAPEIAFLSKVRFKDLAKPSQRAELDASKANGRKVFCIISPDQIYTIPTSINYLRDNQICGEQIYQVDEYRLLQFIR